MVYVDRIMELAKTQGIKLSYLAGLFGLGRTYFQDVKKRNADIPEDRLIVIAEKLHTTPEYLKGETDQKEKPVTDFGNGPNKELLDLIEQLTEDQRQMFIRQIKGVLSDK